MGPAVVWDTESLYEKDAEEDWGQFKQRAGIGIACLYEPATERWYWYDSTDLDELAAHLEDAEVVVSYNGVRYDHVVLDAVLGRRVVIANELDLWEVIDAACGGRRWGKGAWTLGATTTRTLGQEKFGHGATAPKLLAEGRIGKLATYCQRDVQLTNGLWQFMKTYGYIIDPDGQQLRLGVPYASR